MSCRPAGYSSEDEDDDFGNFTFSGDTKTVRDKQKEFSEEQQLQLKEIRDSTETKLYSAIIAGHLEAIIEELDSGTEVNFMLSNEYTPLFLAASFAHAHIISELLERGGDINYTRNGLNLIMTVCQCSRYVTTSKNVFDSLKLLMEHKLDVKAIDRKRRTAFMFASGQGFIEVVRLLKDYSRIDAEDNQGWTALFYAQEENQFEVFKELLEAGINIDHVDVRGNNVRYYAQLNDNTEILELLPIVELEVAPDDFLDKTVCLDEMFENLGKEKRPLFSNDVSIILYGMQCDILIPFFEENKISLLEFLCLTNEHLIDLGVQMSFHRNRIISGLYKFHKHSFKNKSMHPIVGDDDFCTYDLVVIIASCIRHLTTMEAQIKFLKTNLQLKDLSDEKKKLIFEHTKKINNRITYLKHIANLLVQQAAELDSIIPNQPDLITKKSKFSKYNLSWSTFKWVTIIGCVTITIKYIGRK